MTSRTLSIHLRRTGWLVAAWALFVLPVSANDWPQFRGPTSDGIVEAEGLPEHWSRTENVAWVTEIPGAGWSSPIVSGDLVVLTSVTSEGTVETPQGGLYGGGERGVPTDVHHWTVYALDANSGAIQWEREVRSDIPVTSHHLKNTFASETPVTDGERFYVYFGNVGLYCLDLNGDVLWSREVESAQMVNGWGTGASPVLHDGRVYLVHDSEDQSYLMALSAETGAEVWRVERDEGSNWSTPYIWEHDGRTELVTTGAGRVRSYSLDGNMLWDLEGLSSITIPMPFSHGGLLYLGSGYVGDQHRPIYAIRPGASGDISLADGETSNDFIAWSHPQAAPYHPSPVIHNGIYYTVHDRGFFTAHDATTGAEVYDRVRIAVGAAFTASPWVYGDKIFALSEDGDTYVIKPGTEFEVLGVNSLEEFTMATPAIAHGSLFIRTASKLYRIVAGS